MRDAKFLFLSDPLAARGGCDLVNLRMDRRTTEQKKGNCFVHVFAAAWFVWAGNGVGFCQSEPELKKVLEVPFVHGRISVNGILDEWVEYRGVSLSARTGDDESPSRAFVRTAWDEEKLYLAFRVKDGNLFAHETSDAGTPWRDDAVEVYLSVAPEEVSEGKLSPNEYQFIVNLNGAVGSCRGTSLGTRDHSWDADILSGVRWKGSLNDSAGEADQEYTVEIAIPWQALGLEARSNVELLVDFAVTNREKAETTTEDLLYYDWAGLEKFGNPTRWNRLILRRAPVSGSSELVGGEKSGLSMGKDLSGEQGWVGRVIGLILFGLVIVLGWMAYWKEHNRNNHVASEARRGNDASSAELKNERRESSFDEVSEGLQVLARRVKQILEQDYAGDLSASSVAGRLRVSERHMRRALKGVEGQNFSKLLQEIRLKKACQMLVQSDRSISEVALEVGFGEQSYFSRLFKKRFEMSPSEYRATNCGGVKGR